MLRTLHGKLALALLALLVPIGVLFVFSTLTTSQRYHQEISQKVNMGLAARLVTESHLMVDAGVDTTELAAIAKRLAMTNPGVELYILSPQGQVLGASVPAQKLERTTVDLAPVLHFLQGDEALPIRGTNPRNPGNPKVFSAARIPPEGALEGYLYVLLADEAQDSASQMIQSSYVLRLSVWGGLATLVLVFGVGYVLFRVLTRRLNRLSSAMKSFRVSDFALPNDGSVPPKRQNADEVAELEHVFHEMAVRISEQVQALKQADALRRELITNVSHDLRTPLAALQGYLETLLIKEDSLTAEVQRHYVQIAQRHSERLGKLIAELFELATLESHEMRACPEAFPVTELVQDILQKFRLVAEHKNIELCAEFPDTLPFVHADIGLLERALTNLLDNALRYTPAGGRVVLELTMVANTVEVEILDTGRGIASENMPYIFDRFYRVDKYDPSASEGAGLGLAITKRILELHGRSIEASSLPQGGTSFRFSLPLAS